MYIPGDLFLYTCNRQVTRVERPLCFSCYIYTDICARVSNIRSNRSIKIWDRKNNWQIIRNIESAHSSAIHALQFQDDRIGNLLCMYVAFKLVEICEHT